MATPENAGSAYVTGVDTTSGTTKLNPFALTTPRYNWEAIVQGLNLNNAPFGFTAGSPPYPTRREYYKPTISFGFRWDLEQE